MFFSKKKEPEKKEAETPKSNPNIAITSLEMDALKETANIGTGNASIALSNIFKRKVSISLPTLEMTSSEQISKIIAGPNEMVVGVYSKIQEGMQGNILTLMPINAALQIARTFVKDQSADQNSLNEKDKQLLQKVGTAIYSSYLTSLAKFFEKKITFATPSIVSTYGNSIHEFLALHLGSDDKLMIIKLGFGVENTPIKGDFYLLFTEESLTPLLANIRTKMGK